MWEVLLEALIDTAKIVPVLLLVYLVISYLTHHKEQPYRLLTKKSKYYGPLFGGLLGTIPQCGFSAVMADLYSKRAITLGTLFAVFLTTSDEAIPILLAEPTWYKELLIIIGIKFLIGILFGYLVDFILNIFAKKKATATVGISETHKHHEHCECGHDHEEHEHCAHDHCCADNIFLDALIHTAKITGFILLFNVIFGIVIYYVGMENFIGFISINKYLQPLATCLIGLIPNCAGSVFLIEIYMEGGITLASTIAGLSAGSGIGLLILFKANKNIKQNILILLSLYAIGVIVGLALTPIL